MDKTARISVVLPIYNTGKYLSALLDDLLSQEPQVFEIIPVDDASPDHSRELIETYAQKYPTRIKPVFLSENGGLSNARNRGLEQVTGEYVLFMDSDDRLEKGALRIFAEALAAHPADILLFGCIEEYFDRSGALKKTVTHLPKAGCFDTSQALMAEVPSLERETLYGYAWNKLYRVDFLKENNLLFEKIPLIEDIEFNLRAFERAKSLCLMDEACYRYRREAKSESLTGSFIENYFHWNYRRIELLNEQFSRVGIKNEETKNLLGTLLVRYTFSALQRNCDPRSKMDRAQRKKWLTDLYGDPLFQELVPCAEGAGKLSVVLCRLLRGKHTRNCLLVARLIYFVKAKMPVLFAGLKQ